MMDADAFRQVMGHFATGVAIVASRRENGEACGLTANAVTSVSLDPLLVSVCIDRAASSHDCVISSGRFAISVLGAEDEWLARRFSEADTSNKFEGVRLLEAVTGSPVLESALAWLDCGIWKVVEAGDHSIVVGEALEGGARWGTPLLFHRGSYVRLDAGAGGERPIRRRQEVRRATDGAPEAGGLSMSRAVRGGAAVLTPFLVGVAAAAAAQTSAALLLYMGSGFLSALSLIVAVQMVALSVGLWVGTGVPAGGLDVLRRRWLAALLAFATAAVLSGGWMMLRDLGSTGAGRALGLGLLAAWPLYAAGTLMAGLAARGQAERGRPGAAPVAVAAFAGAAAGFLVTGTFLIPAVAPPSIFLGCVVVLSGGAFLYGTSVGDARPESVVHKEATAHGLVEVADRRAGERGIERRLRVNGLVLGAELRESGLPRLDHVRAAAEWLGFRPPRGPVLLVGGGSYALPRLVRERDPDTPITVVERDPAVTRAAYAYFRIQPAHRVRTLYGSARAWVERLSERFELAYVEASGLGRIDTGAVVTVEGLRALAARLEPSGVVLVGGHFTELAAPRLVMASVSGTLCAVFPEVAVYSPMAPAGGEPAAALWAATFGTSDGWPVEVAGWRRWAPDAWLGGRDAVIYTDMEGEPRDISHA